jgi:hypothetical protein
MLSDFCLTSNLSSDIGKNSTIILGFEIKRIFGNLFKETNSLANFLLLLHENEKIIITKRINLNLLFTFLFFG